MVPLPGLRHPLQRIHSHRPHPRQEAHRPRTSPISIPQGTFSALSLFARLDPNLFLSCHPACSNIRTKWLVSRGELARTDPRYAYPTPAGYTTYRPPQNEYGMYAMPPPVYDPNAPRPPVYYGPPPTAAQQDVGTKVDPDQGRAGYQRPTATDEYEPPAGPPPASTVRPQGTGSSNPFLG